MTKLAQVAAMPPRYRLFTGFGYIAKESAMDNTLRSDFTISVFVAP